MSLVIEFYFASSMPYMFRTLIHPSSGPCDFSIVLGWDGIRVADFSLLHGYHIETRTHDLFGDTIEKSQAPDDGCINVRNRLSIEEVI